VPESSLYSMKQDDAEVQMLREIAADPQTPTHLRLRALNSLQRLKEAAEPEPVGDPQERMQAIVERFCPQEPELRDAPQDPMVDLDAKAVLKRRPDPLFLSWIPYLPERAAEAERAITSAARRLSVGAGLTRRRHR
jgi:hypothetical protein